MEKNQGNSVRASKVSEKKVPGKFGYVIFFPELRPVVLTISIV